MKRRLLLLLEIAIVGAFLLFIETAYFGGIALKIGAIKLRSHSLTLPAVIFCGGWLLRRVLLGNFAAPFFQGISFCDIERGLAAHSDALASRWLASRACRLRIALIFCGLFAALAAMTALQPLKRGMIGAYYDNPNWDGAPVMTACEPFRGLARMRRHFSPAAEQYSIEWMSVVKIDREGDYEWTLVSDGGSALFVDERLVVDNGGGHDYQQRDGAAHLTKGFHALRLRYMNQRDMRQRDFAELKVFLSPPGKRTEQAGRPLASLPLFAEMPSGSQWLIGRGLDGLSMLAAALLLGLCAAGVFVAFCSRRLLFPRHGDLAAASLVFLIIAAIHFHGVMTPFDSRWTIHAAVSLIKEGNANLDEYQAILRANDFYAIEERGGHLYTKYPIGASLLVAPLVFLLDQAMREGLALDLQTMINFGLPEGIEKGLAALIVAGVAVMLLRLCERMRRHLPSSLLIVSVFAFCTSAWSTASRALWQHAPSMLMLTLALYGLLLAKDAAHEWLAPLIGLPVAFSYVIRPTNSIAVLVFTLYVLWRHRRAFAPYLAWSAAVAAPFIAYNWAIYHAILPPYYLTATHFTGDKDPFFTALAGILISPSRGLLTFSPVLLFALFGICAKWRQRAWHSLDSAALAILLLHTLLLATFPCWWGGHCYGPRLFTDMLPFLAYFLAPAVEQMSRMNGLRRQFAALLLVCAIGVSFYIHWRGATDWRVYEWNSVSAPEEKLWDWARPQFLHGLK